MAERVLVHPVPGKTLSDQLFALGVEFPCGGVGGCGGCRIRLLEGQIGLNESMHEVLSDEEIAGGWRLACQAEAAAPVVLEVDQWAPLILTDDRAVAGESREGLGVVVDLGTTTLVAELVELNSGAVRRVKTGLNPQGRYGADVMSRIEFALREPGVLTHVIRQAVGDMVAELADGEPLEEVLLCGNTAMHHLFCAESVEPLSHVPFQPVAAGLRRMAAPELTWRTVVREGVSFLPCPGGFVGSDLLCGLIAGGMAESAETMALLDLGTNGEIAVGNRQRIWCASTAAGPAFEGGRIRMGMRAGDGAIDRVEGTGAARICHVIGGGRARGICGSGLVDAAASALEGGHLQRNGRIADAAKLLPLVDGVELTQADIRELQLAKGAIAAGLELLVSRAGGGLPRRIQLAGAFGNYIRVASARRIGLLPAADEQVEPIGNSAVRGARILLLAPSRRAEILSDLLSRLEHVELASDRAFQEAFIAHMAFP